MNIEHFVVTRKNKIEELEERLRRVEAVLNSTPFAFEGRKKPGNFEDILKAVSTFYRISESQLLEKCREQTVAFPRFMVMAMSRNLTSLSFNEIGKKLGGLGHDTVMHGCERCEELCMADKDYRSAYVNIHESLNAKWSYT